MHEDVGVGGDCGCDGKGHRFKLGDNTSWTTNNHHYKLKASLERVIIYLCLTVLAITYLLIKG